ncbi:MAG TPA: hypothetical protein VNV35_10715 [Puia sp.]|nr:hypothetical protein [Puia sp.]
MRKLTIAFVMAAAAFTFLSDCSKHNVGNPYYFTFQSGSITYSSSTADSLLECRDTVEYGYGMIEMDSYRTQALTDSAAAGETTLATWSFYLWNRSSPNNAFTGSYTSDTGASNQKMLESGSVFRFYTSYDPHHGDYYTTPGLPFTVTITQITSTWFEGTFGGMVLETNYLAGTTDTATITNGKFMLPLH